MLSSHNAGSTWIGSPNHTIRVTGCVDSRHPARRRRPKVFDGLYCFLDSESVKSLSDQDTSGRNDE